MRRLWAVTAMIWVVSACGDDDGDESPVSQCNRLTTTFCTRVESCAEAAGYTTSTNVSLRDQCLELVAPELPCEDAISVSRNYSACLKAVRDYDCDDSNAAFEADELPPPPDICSEVVLYTE